MSTHDSRAACFRRSVFSSSRLFPDPFSTTKSPTRQKDDSFLIAKGRFFCNHFSIKSLNNSDIEPI